MNKQRRKELEDLHDNLQNLLEKLETIMEEEEEYKDNIPENMLNRIEQSEISGHGHLHGFLLFRRRPDLRNGSSMPCSHHGS